MKIRYALTARFDIDRIHEFLSERNPRAASKVMERIREAVARLGEFPYMGHVGRAPDTYEWTVRGLPYIIVYGVDEDHGELTILAVFHGAQNR